MGQEHETSQLDSAGNPDIVDLGGSSKRALEGTEKSSDDAKRRKVRSAEGPGRDEEAPEGGFAEDEARATNDDEERREKVPGVAEEDVLEDAEDGPFPSMLGGEDADVDAREGTDTVLTEVLEAAESGDLAALQDALGRLACPVDTRASDGDTALHVACLYGNRACVEALLEAGAAVDCRDEDGAVPLHDACASGFAAIASVLIGRASPARRGALVGAADSDGDTPLHNAARGGHADVVGLLLSHGADPRSKNKAGEWPLMLCEGNPDVVELLEKAQEGA